MGKMCLVVVRVSGPLQETATTPAPISWPVWHLQASPAEQQPGVTEPLILTSVQHGLPQKKHSVSCFPLRSSVTSYVLVYTKLMEHSVHKKNR